MCVLESESLTYAISSISKNVIALFLGLYQPSYDMMLRFYSYFKQSTDGPCKGKRPAFWDVVGKAKYDSWKSLGDMPKNKAMEAYVDDLRKIVETMSYSQSVAEFYESLNEMDKVNVSDLELVAPELMRSKSESNSPVHQHREPVNNNTNADIQNGFSNGSTSESSDDDDEYIDTVEV
jgi:acyl-CoA-binding protein